MNDTNSNGAAAETSLEKFKRLGLLNHARAYDLGNGITAYVNNASGQVKPFEATAFDTNGAIVAFTGYCKTDAGALEAVRKNLAKKNAAKK